MNIPLIGELLQAGAKLVDDLHTSDEEKLEAKQKLEQMLSSFAAAYDAEVTARHAADMKSDSWLSKNIRPLSLAFAVANIFFIAWASIFSELSKTQITALEAWVGPLIGMAGAMITFYFGSRGWEKITKTRNTGET